MSDQGRCWHCGQPRKEIHKTLTCGSEECITAALESREKAQQKIAEAKSRLQRQRLNKKSKQREYNREYMRKYYQRPEAKSKQREYRREYYQRPEVKARLREYYQRPEVKARRCEYARARYRRKKAQEEE